MRKYAYTRLANPAATHEQLASYFNDVPQPEQVRGIADLQPTIELYHHLARAEKYDEAFKLFRDRLATPLYYQLGAYQTIIELLRVLFPDGEDQLPRLSDEGDQGWALVALANSYSLSGQPTAAIPLYEMSNAIDEKRDDKTGVAIGLSNLAVQQVYVGALAGAAVNLRRSIALCREIEDRFQEAIGYQGLGRLLALTGDWAASAESLDTALEMFSAENYLQGQGVNWAYRAEAALLQGQADTAAEAARKALWFADEDARTDYPVERDYVRCYWLLGWAALAQQQFDNAQRHLDTALRRCRAINMVDHEPKILLAHARLATARATQQQTSEVLKTSEVSAALELATEAQTIAERAGYVLDLADIHNLRAQLALDSGDRTLARQHAQAARDYAWCDGPPYAYQVALDEAERLLR